jgi:hypothetical protein
MLFVHRGGACIWDLRRKIEKKKLGGGGAKLKIKNKNLG